MKKLFLIASLFVLSLPSFGQDNVTEAYFHELKGMEDSAGVTHLFYRQFVRSYFQCSEGNGGHKVENRSNDIHHFNVQAQSDKMKFRDGFAEWCLDGYYYDSQGIHVYEFYDNDPEKWIAIGTYEYSFAINDYQENALNIETPILIKQKSKNVFDYSQPNDFYLSPNGDSLYVEVGRTVPFTGRSNQWPDFEDYDDFVAYADSLSFSKKIIGIHPFIDSLYFATNSSGQLFRSEHYTGNFELADTNWYFNNLTFADDTSHIYSFRKAGIIRSSKLGEPGSWQFRSINFTTDASRHYTIDRASANRIFVSDSTTILHSTDYGDNFSPLTTIDHQITGLYKKPDSDLLYVLTREELLEVNVETKATTSLKQIPVSRERLPEVPTQVELKQNYPNPFNPTTVIAYMTQNNGHVQLSVYDQLGRKVQTLVDEFQEAGIYAVTFDAKSLASGIYYYRLEADGKIASKKMTLIK
ncbi:T9SS type A sorting domain-containing protein [Gracilimonas mengyeensis]|uniref:Por secretion system C-terminal sorting domain-containing protein n=1 Tax=Gracilimonas mengyeensis TaxID=1302730 RepID=A0A521C634_9BACT|nr:T9SS type A sorting domain-containing protein [Gracilimonas mengyeensis]SMO54892.1 Por secretion system C-terminal sorting domain-containing protein [Gracilimonas mengyeensis]